MARLRARLETRVADPTRAIEELTGGETDADDFWERVKTNLHAGKVRLIFVADIVPMELQRIVEFLNSQLRSAEVLALEVKRYSGEGFQALISQMIGETAAAEDTKSSGPKPASGSGISLPSSKSSESSATRSILQSRSSLAIRRGRSPTC